MVRRQDLHRGRARVLNLEKDDERQAPSNPMYQTHLMYLTHPTLPEVPAYLTSVILTLIEKV